MDTAEEIGELRNKLMLLNGNITGEMGRINKIKQKLKTVYRRRDREKYEDERRAIVENLKTYQKEQEAVKKRLMELETKAI